METFGYFDDAFERLVTVGQADAYPACVERFKPKFAAIDADLERIAMRCDSRNQQPLSGLVRSIIREERKRLEAKLAEQVLRQRYSISELDDEDRPAIKQRLQKTSAELAERAAAVEEALEELRAEAADIEED